MTDWLRVIYPAHCPVCDRILRFNGGKICAACYHQLTYIKEPRCKKCGKQIEKYEEEYCFDCAGQSHVYTKGLALLLNSGAGKRSVYAIKYRHKREYVDFYTDELLQRYGKEIASWGAQMLVPVPLHRKKELQRGFNQAAVIAASLGKKLRLPVEKRALRRIVNTRPQKELDNRWRKKNLEKAFIVSKNVVKLKKVILIDDIYTTGSTIDACAKVLLQAGAQEVFYISLSIGSGY